VYWVMVDEETLEVCEPRCQLDNLGPSGSLPSQP
jgi:hypothetical protein